MFNLSDFKRGRGSLFFDSVIEERDEEFQEEKKQRSLKFNDLSKMFMFDRREGMFKIFQLSNFTKLSFCSKFFIRICKIIEIPRNLNFCVNFSNFLNFQFFWEN